MNANKKEEHLNKFLKSLFATLSRLSKIRYLIELLFKQVGSNVFKHKGVLSEYLSFDVDLFLFNNDRCKNHRQKLSKQEFS